jgi:hypothetical protein
MLRLTVLLPLAIAAALVIAVPASASLGDEVAAGRTLAGQLRAAKVTCEDLSAGDFERIGEYVMGGMTGSAQLHAAMNERMRSFLGAANEERMHTRIGQRYAGCGAIGEAGPMMGPGMMQGRGSNDRGAWGPMMDSRRWEWMRDGNWQRMGRADWQRLGDQWMGPGMMRAADHGWDTGDTVLVATAAIVAAGLLGALLARKPWRRRSGEAR